MSLPLGQSVGRVHVLGKLCLSCGDAGAVRPQAGVMRPEGRRAKNHLGDLHFQPQPQDEKERSVRFLKHMQGSG